MAYLRIKSARLEDKASASNNHNLEVVDDVNVTVPPLLDEDFEAIEETFMTASDSYIICEGRTDGISLANVALHVEEDTMGVTIRSMGQWVAISHIQHGRSRDVNDTSIEDEVRECFEVMKCMFSYYYDKM